MKTPAEMARELSLEIFGTEEDGPGMDKVRVAALLTAWRDEAAGRLRKQVIAMTVCLQGWDEAATLEGATGSLVDDTRALLDDTTWDASTVDIYLKAVRQNPAPEGGEIESIIRGHLTSMPINYDRINEAEKLANKIRALLARPQQVVNPADPQVNPSQPAPECGEALGILNKVCHYYERFDHMLDSEFKTWKMVESARDLLARDALVRSKKEAT
jgi:hypothetical protein